MKTWDISKRAGLLLWKGKGLWLWQFVCGQKANLGTSILHEFYMSKIGENKRKIEIRNVLKKGKALSSLLSILNYLPPSLQAIKLFTLWKTGNRKGFLVVLCPFSVFLDYSSFVQALSGNLLARDTKRNTLHYPFLFYGTVHIAFTILASWTNGEEYIMSKYTWE